MLQLSGLESPERIDNDSIQLIVQHAHRGKHEEIQLGLCSVYININNQGESLNFYRRYTGSHRLHIKSTKHYYFFLLFSLFLF